MRNAGRIRGRRTSPYIFQWCRIKISGIGSDHIEISSVDFMHQTFNLLERSSDDSRLEDLSKDSPLHLCISSSHWKWPQVFPRYVHRHRASGHRCDGQRIYNNIGRRLQSESGSKVSKINNGRIFFSILDWYCKCNINGKRSKYVDMESTISRISQAGSYFSCKIVTFR